MEYEMVDCHGLDTPKCIYFYEHEYYVFSNFSAFRLNWVDIDFDTSEHAYQWTKFNYGGGENQHILELIKDAIINSRSAHDAYTIAQTFKQFQNPLWDENKLNYMREILRKKIKQHGYVKRKLIQSYNRILIENSFRDAFWGTGPDDTGENWLGKLWMELREELKQEVL